MLSAALRPGASLAAATRPAAPAAGGRAVVRAVRPLAPRRREVGVRAPVSTAAAAAGLAGPSSSPPPASPAHPVAAAMARAWAAVSARIAAACVALYRQPTAEEVESINTAFKTNWRNMRRLAIVAPFASVTSSGGNQQIFVLLTRSVSSFVKLYLLFLFLRVLLSWFPAFNWDRQPWMALRQLTDPYLNVFRGLVPPLFGSIDFTPLVGFFVLQGVEGFLQYLAFSEEELNEGYLFGGGDDDGE